MKIIVREILPPHPKYERGGRVVSDYTAAVKIMAGWPTATVVSIEPPHVPRAR